MRIAVIGSGVSGLVCAWRLGVDHDVTLFEAADYLGGHTHTHSVTLDGEHHDIDSGFIVHNPVHYPHFTALLDELQVDSQDTQMSFSVQRESGLEYNASSLDTLFCQRRRLASPRFWGMVRDLVRFYRQAPGLLQADGPGPTLGDYLQKEGYGAAFRDNHLVPMASALWSSPASRILDFPARYLVQFMANHQMLELSNRPQWRVVKGGSRRYIEAMAARWNVLVRMQCPVQRVVREPHRVLIATATDITAFDQVIFACHSDQALALLASPTPAERQILGAITYQENDAVLHTDAHLLPRHPKAVAAWNAFVPNDRAAPCSVSYCMNVLQSLSSRHRFVVSLNRGDAIDPQRVLARMRYHHPVYTQASVAAQRRRAEISGQQRTWYAGAYWGWGFHEDGVRSALDVVHGLSRHNEFWGSAA